MTNNLDKTVVDFVSADNVDELKSQINRVIEDYGVLGYNLRDVKFALNSKGGYALLIFDRDDTRRKLGMIFSEEEDES